MGPIIYPLFIHATPECINCYLFLASDLIRQNWARIQPVVRYGVVFVPTVAR